MPNFVDQLGTANSGNGLLLGAAGDAPPRILGMPSAARPFIVHVYNNDWTFSGSAAVLTNRPVIHQVLNSGYQPITITVPSPPPSTLLTPGSLCVVTEQGGDATGTAPAGIAIIGGIIEEVPDVIEPGRETHSVTIVPFVAELGDAYLNKNYSTATDVAQMVRDAVAQTNHLRVTPYSCPNTGVTATYNFSYAPALEVIDHARLIAGVNYSWFVDAIGVVWFQAVNASGAATFTVKGGVDYSKRDQNGGSISSLKNFVLVIGTVPTGGSARATGTYSNATSRAKYGLRALNPPVNIPGISNAATLQAIANTIGGVYDRVINRVTIDLPAYPQRILLGQPGGATMRYWEPTVNSLVESENGSGYSATYVVLEVQTDGIQQTVTIGDVPPVLGY